MPIAIPIAIIMVQCVDTMQSLDRRVAIRSQIALRDSFRNDWCGNRRSLQVTACEWKNAFGAQALHPAQKNLEPRWPEGRNTVTGLVNFGHVTCWLNAAVQLLWHSSFMSEWLDYAETRGREARNHA